MPNAFETKWQGILGGFPGVPVDFLASVTEQAVNEYLSCHFENDHGLYKVVIEQPFEIEDLSGKLVATVEAKAPLVVDFKPFTSTNHLSVRLSGLNKLYRAKNGWHPLAERATRLSPIQRLHPPRISQRVREDEPDVRVTCQQLYVKLEWPKLDNPQEMWSWEAEYVILAEGIVGLKEIDGTSYLQIQPTRIKLSLPTEAKTNFPTKFGKLKRKDLLEGRIGRLPRPANDDDQKFRELVVIVANMLTAQYAPTLVQNIKIPVLQISDKQVYPVFLDVSDHMATVGVSLDRAGLAQQVSYDFDEQVQYCMRLLRDDIEAAGGLEGLAYSDPEKRVVRSRAEIQKQFVRTNVFIADMKKQLAKRPTPKALRRGNVTSAQEGMGAAINSYFIKSLLELAMPSPVSECTGWANVANLLRGRVCYGISISDPVADISGTSITGGAHIELGGSVEGCIGDGCDHWACTRIALSLEGNPTITLTLSTGTDGVVLRAQFDLSSLHLHTNLPWPFNKVIEALGYVVIQAITLIVNIVLGLIDIKIIVPSIKIPDQNTRLILKDFAPFPFVRTDPALPATRNTFIGYTVTVDAGV